MLAVLSRFRPVAIRTRGVSDAIASLKRDPRPAKPGDSPTARSSQASVTPMVQMTCRPITPFFEWPENVTLEPYPRAELMTTFPARRGQTTWRLT